MFWTKPNSLNARYFDAFYRATYEDGARIATEYKLLSDPPLRRWRYRPDPEKEGEAAGWSRPEFDDAAWETTDCAVETWSDLGLHNDMGALWYRTTVAVPAVTAGKKVYL